MLGVIIGSGVVLLSTIESDEEHAALRRAFRKRTSNFDHHRHARRIVHRAGKRTTVEIVVMCADDHELVFAHRVFTLDHPDDISPAAVNQLQVVTLAARHFQTGGLEHLA
ncbi:MAG: hypothetical protein JMDDDDMK_04726 [Acidobacteria bacterium]|nr:hypothetical protein [Acidobacteriota bacterium]